MGSQRTILVFIFIAAAILGFLSVGGPRTERSASGAVPLSVSMEPIGQQYMEAVKESIVAPAPPPPVEPTEAAESLREAEQPTSTEGIVAEGGERQSLTLYDQSPDVQRLRGCEKIAKRRYTNAELIAKSGWGKDAVPMSEQSWYQSIMRCLGDAPERIALMADNVTYWEERSVAHATDTTNLKDPWSHPAMNHMHGGLSPQRGMEHALALAALLKLPQYMYNIANTARWSPKAPHREMMVESVRKAVAVGPHKDVLVEIGCGNAAMLYSMCPPHPWVRCFGSDTAAAAIKFGQKFMPHITLEVGPRTTKVPCGTARGVFSNSVIMYLDADRACAHIEEALRVADPGGYIVFWGLNSQFFAVPKNPTFFKEKYSDGTTHYLQFCKRPIGNLVASMEILDKRKMPLFSADLKGVGWYGVRMVRNDEPFPSARCAREARDPKRYTVANQIKIPEEALSSSALDDYTDVIFKAASVTNFTGSRTHNMKLEAKRKKKEQQRLDRAARQSQQPRGDAGGSRSRQSKRGDK